MSKQQHHQSPGWKTSEMPGINPLPHIISPINVPNKCMVNPYSQGDEYNNNPYETFAPVSNLLPIQNPYLPNGTLINNTKYTPKEDGASSNLKQSPTPLSDEEEQARMMQAGMTKSGLAMNPNINKNTKNK
eukprot:8447291-Ditylum_brightwellii.AAC.1